MTALFLAAVMLYGQKVCELEITERSGQVEGTTVGETVRAALGSEACAFLDGLGENASVVLHMTGRKDYDMMLENARAELADLAAGLDY